MTRHASVSYLGGLVALVATFACGPSISDEARAELQAIRDRLEMPEPDPKDPESLARARAELDAALLEYGAWRKKHIAAAQGNCEFDCLAAWMICMEATLPGVQAMAGRAPGAAAPAGAVAPGETPADPSAQPSAAPGGSAPGHTPPDWDQYCDWKYRRCTARCGIILDL